MPSIHDKPTEGMLKAYLATEASNKAHAVACHEALIERYKERCPESVCHALLHALRRPHVKAGDGGISVTKWHNYGAYRENQHADTALHAILEAMFSLETWRAPLNTLLDLNDAYIWRRQANAEAASNDVS